MSKNEEKVTEKTIEAVEPENKEILEKTEKKNLIKKIAIGASVVVIGIIGVLAAVGAKKGEEKRRNYNRLDDELTFENSQEDVTITNF